jgi:hypothetical protein
MPAMIQVSTRSQDLKAMSRPAAVLKVMQEDLEEISSHKGLGGTRLVLGDSRESRLYLKVNVSDVWFCQYLLFTDIVYKSTTRIELGINFSHIRAKSLTVLNPLRTIDEHIMDDADLAGPIIVIFGFATFLLLVCFS